ncbi:hypothetical protein [Streptomyces sp. NPDC005181]|uniref:hypothetical protein n=1 Tax=Streptomyces sp. NPDC005181 TaxID=3156869 RepID=UPI0033B189A0
MMPRSSEDDSLDVDDFATVVEKFAGIFIRLPSVEKLSFTTLSVLHTLANRRRSTSATPCSTTSRRDCVSYELRQRRPHPQLRAPGGRSHTA